MRLNNGADLLKDLAPWLTGFIVNELDHLAHIAARLLHLSLIKIRLAPNGLYLAADLLPTLVHTLSRHQR